MKLWYQSLVRDLEVTPFGDMVQKLLNRCASPGTEVVAHGIAKSSGFGVHYRFLEYNDAGEVIQNAIRAEKEGYDAFIVGNVSDAGLREAKEMVNIPVLGVFEASLHMACLMGASFGLINISPKWTPRIMENVRRSGLESRLAGCESLDTSPLELKKAVHDESRRQEILDDVSRAAKRLLDRGAEVIFPVGGDVVVFLADANIFEMERAPIVFSHGCVITLAEAAVKMKRLTGIFNSKHLQSAPPTGEFLKRVRDFYGPDVYPGAE